MEYAVFNWERGEDEPERRDQSKQCSSEDEPLKEEMIESLVGSSVAEYARTERWRAKAEQARRSQDTIKSEAAESNYDVFLSFSGSENPFRFADSLYCRLKAGGCLVFRDDVPIRTPKELPTWVHSSKVYIPIFTGTYGYSPWCLESLALMVERASRSGGKEEVLPVFYNREPSDVKLETSLYNGTLDMLRRTWSAERVERWEKALVEAGNVKGWELRSYKSEGELTTTIVEEILPKLKIEHSYAPGDPSTGAELLKTNVALLDRFTGAGSLEAKWKTIKQVEASFQGPVFSDGASELEDSQETKIMELLELEVNDVRIVGIHGRDGIGKTELVKIVYDQISLRFDACSFLAEIEETVQQPGGLQYLQTKLIFDMLKREYEVASAFKGVRCLKEILRNMKVLLVLDDVEDVSLLKEFVGAKLDWFGSGSRIIVTSKQRRVLQGFIDRGVAHTYDVSPMDDNRASDLFWQYAMGKSYKHQPYVEIANKIVRAAKGLPLLVKIFGSFLHGKGREEWIKFRDLMRQFQEDYQKILSIIYEALDPKQKQMYLDIARFLPDVDCRIASYMWHDYDHPDDRIEVLSRMSLIKTEENKIGMHSMLRCLARKVIYEGFHDPGTRVRFYIPAIAHDTKKRKRGADHLNTIMAGFEILPSTTFLSLGHTNIGGRFADALLNVRWLHWQGCPPDFEANSIYLENLVILDLSWSKVTGSWGGWKGIQMERLKVLNLTGCADLLITPNFSCYPKLEILILERCSRLVHLDPSINELKLLVTLNLKFCSELNMLPVEMDGMSDLRELLIDGTSIRELPESIGKLALLQILSATNCFSLVCVPGSVCELELLSVLALDKAKILELPESIGNLWGLTRLSLSDCRGLGKLPESIGELEYLVELDISGTRISKLPDSTENMQGLKVLKMDYCFLREFPRGIGALINLEEVHASWCRSLEGDIPSDISKLHRLRELRLRGTRISSLPLVIQSMSSLQTLDLLYCELLEKLPPLPSGLTDLHVNPNLKQ